MNFVTALFAVAGLIAAGGPILIHLLNRRRFQVVNWAAMDFLREAMQRNRKVLQLRDLLLLALRILVIVGFGLALARPFFSQADSQLTTRYVWLGLAVTLAFAAAIWAVLGSVRTMKRVAWGLCLLCVGLSLWNGTELARARRQLAGQRFSDREPVHAVLVIDNSLSMGTETLQGTWLDMAKTRALQFVEKLPPQSRVSVVPLCGSVHVYSLDAYRSREDAQEAIGRIEVVDRSGSAVQALELAAQACRKVPELPAKRVVFLSDQQKINWPAAGLNELLAELPDLQVVQIVPEDGAVAENVWVSEFRVQDGVADSETATNFLATVQYAGGLADASAQVSLTVDNVLVASQTVDLQPGQARQLEFPYRIDIPAEPGRPKFVTAQVAVTLDGAEGDALPRDNARWLSVPVVAGIPVVFVDELGDEETVNQRGETYRLRRLLAPQASGDAFQKQLIVVRHKRMEELSEELLADARLTIIAGVREPGDKAELLREYVEQGGQLVIAAGGDFDPALWQEQAWQNGAGLLPAKLHPTLIGGTEPDQNRRPVFHLDFQSMQHDYFLIEGAPAEELKELYETVRFYKTVGAVADAETQRQMIQAETERIRRIREELTLSDANRREWEELEKQGLLGETEAALQQADEQRRRQLRPQWLLWQREQLENLDELAPEELAERSRPRVLATYRELDVPFLIDRKLGRGQTLFFTTGLQTELVSADEFAGWNSLALSYGFLMFDRIFRQLLEETLPRRTFETGARIALPAEPGQRYEYTLTRPGGFQENLPVLSLGAEAWGITIPQALTSGVYQVRQTETSISADAGEGEKISDIPLVINGPPPESELTAISETELRERLGETAGFTWISPHEEIRLEGSRIQERNLWKVLATLVLGFLALEMLILGWPAIRRGLSGEETA